jgi:hypothetical protein
MDLNAYDVREDEEEDEDVLFMRSSSITPLIVDDFDYLHDFVGQTRTLALLLDYDGTLAPIAPRPDLALLPPETKKVLERLSRSAIMNTHKYSRIINISDQMTTLKGKPEVKERREREKESERGDRGKEKER